MPGAKRPSKPTKHDSSEAVLEALRSQKAVLEDMRSENRLTAETVNARADGIEKRLDDGLRESRERDALLEAAIRSVRADLKADIVRVEAKLGADIVRVEAKLGADIVRVEAKLGADIVRVEAKLGADIARVETKVDTLVPIEERVAALERRGR